MTLTHWFCGKIAEKPENNHYRTLHYVWINDHFITSFMNEIESLLFELRPKPCLNISDSAYGSLERNNLTGKQEWTGLIGELVSERADLIVAPLTINPERAQVSERGMRERDR